MTWVMAGHAIRAVAGHLSRATAAGLPGAAGGVPAAGPDNEEARRWAQEELAKSAYQPSLGERIAQWFSDRLHDLISLLSKKGPGDIGLNQILGVLGAAVLLILLVMVVRRARRSRGDGEDVVAPATPVFDNAPLPASDYLALARRAQAEGRAGEAVLAGFRSIAATLVERGVVTAARGATAGEFADAAGAGYPAYGQAAWSTAATFDATRYGDRSPGAPPVREVLELAERLAAREAPTGADGGAGPGSGRGGLDRQLPAVPR